MNHATCAWKVRALALDLASRKLYLPAWDLWRAARLMDGEFFKYELAEKRASSPKWMVYSCTEEGLDALFSTPGTPRAWGWPGLGYEDDSVYQSHRILRGVRRLGLLRDCELWVVIPEEHEELCYVPEDLLDALVGRCKAEGVGASWAPLRDAEAWLKREEA